jgi:hypothetical protein
MSHTETPSRKVGRFVVVVPMSSRCPVVGRRSPVAGRRADVVAPMWPCAGQRRDSGDADAGRCRWASSAATSMVTRSDRIVNRI